jgi:hypothetical protein
MTVNSLTIAHSKENDKPLFPFSKKYITIVRMRNEVTDNG